MVRQAVRVAALLTVLGIGYQAMAFSASPATKSISVSTWAGSIPDYKTQLSGYGTELGLSKIDESRVLDVRLLKGVFTEQNGSIIDSAAYMASIEATANMTAMKLGQVNIVPSVFIGGNTLRGIGTSDTRSQVYLGGGLKAVRNLGPKMTYEASMKLVPLAWNSSSRQADEGCTATSTYYSSSLTLGNNVTYKVSPSLKLFASSQIDCCGFVDQWEKTRFSSSGKIVQSDVLQPAGLKKSWKLSTGFSWTF